MHITEFIRKWKASKLKERSGSQEHFIDLCRVLGQKTPSDADPEGKWYTFEKGAIKQTGKKGFADVWRKGYFAWEYKGKHADLEKAYVQLLLYRSDLENPPLLIVSDMEIIEIHTNFTNTPEITYKLALDDLAKPENLEKLKWIFTNPERFKPGITVDEITAEAAETFAKLAQTLRERNHPPSEVAHFLSKLVFCLFAEDVAGLLPKLLIIEMIESAEGDVDLFNDMLRELFTKMGTGGRLGTKKIRHFNGGLFNDDVALPLTAEDLKLLYASSKLDWSNIEPSIFGTLFERGLDPAKRSQLGAHYTPRSDIERVVYPVVIDPLQTRWAAISKQVDDLLETVADKTITSAPLPEHQQPTGLLSQKELEAWREVESKRTKQVAAQKSAQTKTANQARSLIQGFLEEIRGIRILDPACGSGNFLYISLESLHNLEKQVLLKLADIEGNLSSDIKVGPHQVMGIELNPYAAELAQVTIWIGHLQWMLRNGFWFKEDPILQKLENIQCNDAILDLSDPANPKIQEWPAADYIVGNPPFLGDKKMISELGESYAKILRKTYKDQVPGQADLVCYWFERAKQQLEQGKVKRAGFVATNSIRGGKNRVVLDHICENYQIVNAWSDEPWIVDGAAVRISLVCFAGKNPESACLLNSEPVAEIHSDLTGKTEHQSHGADLTKANQLRENHGISFIGTQKNGDFDIPGDIARIWLKSSGNPNGRSNSDVIKPWVNGMDITRRPSDTWIIDFGINMLEDDAELYETPFEHVVKNVKPARDQQRRESRKNRYWLLGEPMPKVRQALSLVSRYIVTPRVSKYRLFAWLDPCVLPDSAVVAITRDNDTTFGILHSKFHELWALRLGTSLENRPRYTPSTTFETFPFPPGLTPNLKPEDYNNPHTEAIAAAAKRLNELRENWLNPLELVQRVPEVVPGYPDRILAVNEEAAQELKKRTLTNLYNQRPAWLDKAHKKLDEAVAAAYGWPVDLADDEILARLLALNLERSQTIL